MSEPFLIDGHATGALPRQLDTRDFHLDRLPEVRARLAAGLPPSFYVTPLDQIPSSVKLDQGPVPRCVASSTCISKSLQEWLDIETWQAYNDVELYAACGGTGQNGVYTDTVLRHAKDTGVLVAQGGKRFRISSYMFAPRVARQFRETIAAALVQTGPCVIAMLLPSNLGWNSSGDIQGTNSYHQMAAIGYEGLGDNDWCVFLNSWGSGWGNQGFCRVRWSTMETGGSFQSVGGYQYVYAYQIADFIDGATKPDPPKPDPPDPEPGPKKVVVTATGQGDEAARIRVGDYLLWGSVRYDVANVAVTVDPGPDPPDPPDPPEPEGELTINAAPSRLEGGRVMLSIIVRAGADPVPAFVDVAGYGQVIYGGKRPASKVLGVVASGTIVTLSAREAGGDKRTGTAVVTV